MQHCSLLRQSAKRKVDIICAMEDKLLYRDEVYAIQGALFDVYFGSYPRVTIERFAL